MASRPMRRTLADERSHQEKGVRGARPRREQAAGESRERRAPAIVRQAQPATQGTMRIAERDAAVVRLSQNARQIPRGFYRQRALVAISLATEHRREESCTADKEDAAYDEAEQSGDARDGDVEGEVAGDAQESEQARACDH
jgi:hypothetical protein